MVQGGVEGMYRWLKLDPDYLEQHCSEICNLAYHSKTDLDDPYQLLWILLEYSGASSKPWMHLIIDPKAINDLALDAQMGNEESRELLVLYLYRTVAKVSGRFSWARERFSFDKADLIHQGILGIYKALDRWSLEERADFPHWCEQWIFQEIKYMVSDEGSLIRIPYNKRILQSKLPKIREELESELGRKASYEEMAWFIRAEGHDHGLKNMMDGREIAMLETQQISSLNIVVNEDEFDYVEVQDLIPDDGSNLLTKKIDPIRQLECKDLLDVLMDKLDDTERFVVMNYQKGEIGNLKAAEVASELAEYEMTSVEYTQAAISQIFERACIKMRFAAYEMDLTEDEIFS